MMQVFLVLGAIIIFYIIVNNWLNGIIKRNTNNNAANAQSDTPKNIDQAAPPVMPDNESSQDFLIVHSMRMLTDLAASQGLINSKDEAVEYWRLFKNRIRNVHLNGKSVTLDEVKSAIEKELAPVFQSSLDFVNNGMPENLALAKSVVNWYQKSLEQTTPPLSSPPKLKANEINIDGLHKIYIDFISGKYNVFSTDAKTIPVSDLLMIRNGVNELINDGLTENEAVRCALENYIQNQK